MDRKWKILEKYFDEELNESEEIELNEMLKTDPEFRKAFQMEKSLINDIHNMHTPYIQSRKDKIMEIIKYIKPEKRSRFVYALPILFSYSLITTIVMLVKFGQSSIDFIWTHSKNVILILFNIIAKSSIVIQELDTNLMIYSIIIPIIALSIVVPSGIFLKKEIKKGDKI